MLSINLHIGEDTVITWNRNGPTIWVEVEEGLNSVTIYVSTENQAKNLVRAFQSIRAREWS